MLQRLIERSARALAATATLAGALASPAVAADEHGRAATSSDAPAADLRPAPSPAATLLASVSGDDAVKMLAGGNARFSAGGPTRPHQDQARLCDTFANGQHPYAAVLSCADSRVPVELVFDAGIGDLFVVRVAGNVSDVDEIGTLEYGVEHLGINAIMVMGHTKCGAVTAVVDKAHVTKNIEKLVDNIVPAADAARKALPQLGGPQLVGKAIEMNVRRSMADLVANSDVIRERVKAGTLKIVGGVYDLHTGEVNWLESAPLPNGAAAPQTSAAVSATLLKEDVAVHGAPAEKPAKKDDVHAFADETKGEHAPAAKPAHESSTKGAHGPAAKDPHSAAERQETHGAAGHTSAAEGQPHAAAATATTQPAKKENYVALGTLMGGGAVVSFALIHLMKGRSAATPAEKPAAEATASKPS